MRLEKLYMQNFRGFAEIELDFSKAGSLAVLIGKNGAGKSSVLDCAGMFLGRFAGCVHDPKTAIWRNPMTTKDIRHNTEGAHASVSYAMDDPPGFSLTDEVSLHAHSLDPFFPQLLDYTKAHLARLATDKSASVPLLFYYQSDRGIGILTHQSGRASGLSTRESADDSSFPPQARAYRLAFGANGAGPFQMFLQWFRAQEDIENQTRLRKDLSYKSKHLGPVRAAIERFMGSLPDGGSFTNLRAEREAVESESELFKVSERISYLIDKDGDTLAVEQLSDGERSTLLLIADLAMRLVIANPGLADPLVGTGIVLIDELESHLHPAWQRAILPGLARTFPNCQFIVTTHSPQVLSKVPRESVFILDNFQLAGAAPHTYGRDSNAILEEVMGVLERPEEATEKIRQIGELIDKEDLDGARRELGKLEAWIGERDPEIARLNRLIDFMD